MLFITLNIRETVNSSNNLLLKYQKPVIKTKIEIMLCLLQMEQLTQAPLEEENLDLSIADLDPSKIHLATIIQIKLI